MLIDDFNSEFNMNISNGDLQSANTNIMHELGRILATERQDFVHLLNESGVKVHEGIDDADLVDIYFENLSKNKNLALGTSLLVNHHNKVVGFNGENEINDRNVKAGYVALTSYFSSAEGDSPIGSSTLGGAASGGLTGTIIGAVGDASKFGTQIAKNRAQKKYGVQNIVSKTMQSKAAIANSILKYKQKQIEQAQKETEQKGKTKRTLMIVGGGLLGAAIIGAAIWYFKFKK
jgi:hypothetical protein